jgi:hypothetical protein
MKHYDSAPVVGTKPGVSAFTPSGVLLLLPGSLHCKLGIHTARHSAMQTAANAPVMGTKPGIVGLTTSG